MILDYSKTELLKTQLRATPVIDPKSVTVPPSLTSIAKDLHQDSSLLANLDRLQQEQSTLGQVSLPDGFWYESEAQPLVGTSLIVEVELSSCSSSDADEGPFAQAKQDRLAKDDNVFSKLRQLENPDKSPENHVAILGKTHF